MTLSRMTFSRCSGRSRIMSSRAEMMLLATPSCSPMRPTCFLLRSSLPTRCSRMYSDDSMTPSGLRSSWPMEPMSWPNVASRSVRACCAIRSSR